MSQRAAQIAGHLNYPKGLLAGQVAIITGSGQGIGAEAARLFANEGAKVVVSDIDAAKAAKVAEDINKSGGKAISVAGDMLDAEYLKVLVKKTAEFGNGKIHIIVNNAGYTWDGVIHKMTDKQWEAMLSIHNTAPFRLVRAAANHMRESAKAEIEKFGSPQQNRSIVNVSSTSGLHGNAGQANYSTAKMGVLGFTKTVAKEWGSFGIRCNSIAFGLIDTRLTQARSDKFIEVEGEKVSLGIPKEASNPKIREMLTPLRRAGTPEEAASGILLLCSPYASYITGHCLEVTGGAGI